MSKRERPFFIGPVGVWKTTNSVGDRYGSRFRGIDGQNERALEPVRDTRSEAMLDCVKYMAKTDGDFAAAVAEVAGHSAAVQIEGLRTREATVKRMITEILPTASKTDALLSLTAKLVAYVKELRSECDGGGALFFVDGDGNTAIGQSVETVSATPVNDLGDMGHTLDLEAASIVDLIPLDEHQNQVQALTEQIDRLEAERDQARADYDSIASKLLESAEEDSGCQQNEGQPRVIRQEHSDALGAMWRHVNHGGPDWVGNMDQVYKVVADFGHAVEGTRRLNAISVITELRDAVNPRSAISAIDRIVGGDTNSVQAFAVQSLISALTLCGQEGSDEFLDSLALAYVNLFDDQH